MYVCILYVSVSYDCWWLKESEEHEQTFKNATTVVYILKKTCPYILACLDRNLDEDVRGQSMFKDVPITNAFGETIFACWDKSVSTGAGVEAVKGIVMARLTGALDTRAQRREKTVKWVKSQAKKGNMVGDIEAEIERKSKELNILDYFNHDPEESWEI